MGTERGQILLDAHEIINGDRQQNYGNPEDTHGIIADLWNGYMNSVCKAWNQNTCGREAFVPPLQGKDVALMMVLFKIGRELNGAGCKDNMVDAAGYIALAAEMDEKQ